MVASAKKKKKGEERALCTKRKASEKRKNIVFMLCGVRKEGKVFFSPSAQKKISSTSKHFSYINGRIRIYDKV
jgi:hypothetical protein